MRKGTLATICLSFAAAICFALLPARLAGWGSSPAAGSAVPSWPADDGKEGKKGKKSSKAEPKAKEKDKKEKEEGEEKKKEGDEKEGEDKEGSDKEGGDKEKGEEKEGEGGEGKSAGGGHGDFSPEEAAEFKKLEEEIASLRTGSLVELDEKSPRFVSKTPPAFVVTRPGGGKAPKKTSSKSKVVQVDGTRWGFVNLEARKKRLLELHDKQIAYMEKAIANAKVKQDIKDKFTKDIPRVRASRSRTNTEFEKIRCRIELSNSQDISIVIQNEERAGVDQRTGGQMGGEKALREAMKTASFPQNFKVTKEETDKGRYGPVFTYYAEGEAQNGDKTEEIWVRKTCFVIGKQKEWTVFLTITCEGPKAKVDEQVQKEFEAFIKGVQYDASPTGDRRSR